MKANIAITAAALFIASVCAAQEVIIKGTLRCMNHGVATSTRGAVNIIIVPSFNPKAAVATSTTPQGFFQVNTGWKAGDLVDRNVSLYIVTKCSGCRKIQRIFISEDLDKRNTDPGKMYVTIKGWQMLENCQNAELPDIASARLLDSARRLPAEDISGNATGSPALGPVSFLNLFQKLATAAAAQNSGLFKVSRIDPGDIRYGIFLHSSPMTNTDNTGFNFSPSRNLSEAVFWNPSGIAFSGKPNSVSLLANFKNNIKLSGFQRLTNKLSLAAGGIYTRQDQNRQIHAQSVSDDDPSQNIPVSHPEKLEEFAAFVAPVYQINKQFSAAVTVKSIWQHFNNPNLVAIQQNNGDFYNFFGDDSVRRQRFDADVSFTYRINSYLQAGVSVMNVAGSKLYAEEYVPDSTQRSYVNQRAYGAGMCYRHGRLNVGADVLLTDKDLYDVSLGANYVPFNGGLVSAGYAFKQKSFSVAFRLKHFRIAYIDDNNLVANTRKPGKNKVFNGKIYSGFVFDF